MISITFVNNWINGVRKGLLTYADLTYAIGNGIEIKHSNNYRWHLVWTKIMLVIGCQQHSIDDWLSFDDSHISKMDGSALDFWCKYKSEIMQLVTA